MSKPLIFTAVQFQDYGGDHYMIQSWMIADFTAEKAAARFREHMGDAADRLFITSQYAAEKGDGLIPALGRDNAVLTVDEFENWKSASINDGYVDGECYPACWMEV